MRIIMKLVKIPRCAGKIFRLASARARARTLRSITDDTVARRERFSDIYNNINVIAYDNAIKS